MAFMASALFKKTGYGRQPKPDGDKTRCLRVAFSVSGGPVWLKHRTAGRRLAQEGLSGARAVDPGRHEVEPGSAIC
jgi:hypothetical protein